PPPWSALDYQRPGGCGPGLGRGRGARGADDMPVALARRLLGPEKVVGASAGTPEEARSAGEEGADYVGIGAVFATGSKTDAGDPIGLEGLRRVRAAVPGMPAVAIAGVTADNAAAAIEAGADGVAVISA